MHGADIGVTKVPNPHGLIVPDVKRVGKETVYREALVTAAVSFRDDPLGHMFHRGEQGRRLGEAQYRAGRRWQREHEAAGVGKLRSSGDIREPVDGGLGATDGITDRQLAATKRLNEWRVLLGESGYRLIEAVLGEKKTLRQCAMRFYGDTRPANMKFVGRLFREGLTTLAKSMGFA